MVTGHESQLLLPERPLRTVLVVGAGLIGTSAALALTAAGVDVALDDLDQGHVATAVSRGAGRPWTGQAVDHVLLAVPADAVAPQLVALQRRDIAQSFSDVASVKAHVEREIKTSGGDLRTFVGGHPMAGRERGGPEHADAALFLDRPWALCATPVSTAPALAASRALVQLCGGVPVLTTAARHDRAVAMLSHLPQLLASALAGRVADLADAELRLAGQGWRDMTRIADSDPRLWAAIVASNAEAIAASLTALVAELTSVLATLGSPASSMRQDETRPGEPSQDARETEAKNTGQPGAGGGTQVLPPTMTTVSDAVQRLVERGNAGRRRLPDKDRADTRWDQVLAVVDDRPGELARLLLAAGDAGVNVEDLQVEHQVAHRTGEVTLHVTSGSGHDLGERLRTQGWRCRVEVAQATEATEATEATPPPTP